MKSNISEIKDLFFMFGATDKVRISKKRKLKYLVSLKNFYEKKTKYKFDILKFKFSRKTSLIGVAGDLKKADTLICTYYDTPVLNFSNSEYKPFEDKQLRNRNTINFIISFILVISIFIVLYIFLIRPILSDGIFNIFNFLAIGLTVFFINLITKITYSGGIPKRNNLLRNTSSIVTMLYTSEFLINKKKKIAFIFVDYGCQDDFGYLMLSQYLNRTYKKIILLDNVGAKELSSNELISTKGLKSEKVINIFGKGSIDEINYDNLDKAIKIIEKEIS